MVWEDAVRRRKEEGEIYEGRLAYVALEDVKVVNAALREYDAFSELVFLSYPSNFPFLPAIPVTHLSNPHRSSTLRYAILKLNAKTNRQ